MNSLEYWRKREQAQREKRIADEDERNRRIAQLYAEMQDAVQKQIDAFYGKYARAEGISIAEAKKRAAQLDIDAYARKAKKYVKEKDFTDKANAEMKLYNMTMKVNRLELLKAEIGSELCAGFSDLEKEFDGDLMSDAIGEMRRQSGILGVTISDQAQRARSLVDASFHNATFSDRIWMYQDMLKNELSTLLQEGLIQGRNSKELARHLTKLFGVSEHDSERLMRTEMTRVYTAAQQESLTEAGYDEYTFIAEPTACDVCLALDGQHFPVEDLEDIGNHAPPIHPNCRCSVAAYMDREEFDRWLDGRDDQLERFSRSPVADIIRGDVEQKISWPPRGEPMGKDMAKRLRDYGRSKGINVFGLSKYDLDETTVKMVIDDLAQYVQAFPELLEGKNGLRFTASDMASSTVFSGTKNKMITINVNAYRDISRLKDEYKKRVEEGWFPKGTDYHALMAHEVGHCIHDQYPDINPIEIAMQISGKKTATGLSEYLIDNLSEYSSSVDNGDEIISECYASILTGVKNEFALKFVAECDKIIKQNRKEARS